MKYSIKSIVLFTILMTFNVLLRGQEDAMEIYTRATDQLLTENMELVMELDIKDKKGRVKEKSFEVLVARFGDVEKTKMSWQKPVAAKGTTVIFTELPGETGLIEVFTPSNGKIRKLKATPENMKLVGSEGQMSNITARNPDELTFSLLSPGEVDGKPCFNIAVKDKNSTDDARGELLVEMESYRIVQITIFDKSGKKSSFVTLTDFQTVDGPDHKIQPMRIITKDLKNQKSIEMRVLKIASRTDLKEADFQLTEEL